MLNTEQKTNIRNVLKRYVWPGGYPVFAVMDDGAPLCPQCVKDNFRKIVADTRSNARTGWGLADAYINYEEPDLYCDHCGERIQSAYCEE